MRDPLTTRRLLAKIDRDEDVYVLLDRVRQAIYDIDDFTGRIEARVHGLESERSKFQTESGVYRLIETKAATQSKDWSTWVIRAGLGGLGAAGLGFIGWVLRLAYKGFTAS